MTFDLIDGACTAPAVAPSVPCCGVLAVANFAGVPFGTAWAAILPHVKRPNAWKGSTFNWQRRNALKALGVEWTEQDLRDKRMSFATFAAWYAKPGVMYKIHCKGHVVTLFDGIMSDQCDVLPAAEHRSRRNKVTTVWTRV